MAGPKRTSAIGTGDEVNEGRTALLGAASAQGNDARGARQDGKFGGAPQRDHIPPYPVPGDERSEAQPSVDLRLRHDPQLLAANRAHRVRVAHGRQRCPAPAWGKLQRHGRVRRAAAVISQLSLFSSARATAL